MKTLKISQLIKILEEYKKGFGDLPVIHSSDCEGNQYNTVDERSFGYMTTDKVGKVLLISPFEENIEDDLFDWSAPWEE